MAGETNVVLWVVAIIRKFGQEGGILVKAPGANTAEIGSNQDTSANPNNTTALPYSALLKKRSGLFKMEKKSSREPI